MNFFRAQSIGRLLKEYLKSHPLGETMACDNISRNKQIIFGAVIAGHINVTALKQGILFVTASNSAFRQEIEITKKSIIARAKNYSNGFEIKDIKFRR